MSPEEAPGGMNQGFLDDKERKFLEMFLGRAPEMKPDVQALLADLEPARAGGDRKQLWHALTDRHIADPDTADDILDSIKYESIIEGMRRSGVQVRMPFGREDHLFARLALQKNVLGLEDLTEAIKVQGKLMDLGVSKPLGEVAFDAEIMDKDAVESVVESMRAVLSPRGAYRFPAFRLSDDQDTRVGTIFKAEGKVPEKEIENALDHQRKLLKAGIWKPLGEILFERGLINEQQLHIALGVQAAARSQRTPRRRRGRSAASLVQQLVVVGIIATGVIVLAVLVFGGKDGDESKGQPLKPKKGRQDNAKTGEGIIETADDPVPEPPSRKPKPADAGSQGTGKTKETPKGDGLVEFEGKRMPPEERERIILTRFAEAVRNEASRGIETLPDGARKFKE